MVLSLNRSCLILSLLFLSTSCFSDPTLEQKDDTKPIGCGSSVAPLVIAAGPTLDDEAIESDRAPSDDASIPALGVMGGIKLFFTSLFDPFLSSDAQAFYQRQKNALQTQGILEYTKSITSPQVKWAKEHPVEALFDTLSLSGALVLGQTGLAGTYPQLVTAYQSLNMVRPVASVLKDISTQDLEKWLPRLIEAGAYSATLYLVTQLPVGANAASFSSYGEARRAYGGYGCPIDDQIVTEAQEVSVCLKEAGSTLELCQERLAEHSGLTKDLYIFTRHPSATHPSLDPVSITRLDLNQTCIQSALTPDSPVTQICYTGQATLNTTFNVTRLDGLTLSQGHEGLPSGASIRHLGIHHQGHSCGLFNTATTQYELGNKPLCFKTATEVTGPVTQLCLDPSRPEVMTVKEVARDGSLSFPEDGSPAFQVFDTHQTYNLDIRPDDGAPPLTKPSVFNPQTMCALNETVPLECDFPLVPHHGTADSKAALSDTYLAENDDDLDLLAELSSLISDTTARLENIAAKWWGRKWWFQRGTSLQKID